MQQVVDFILELDKLKCVTRKTRPLGLDRYENSAERVAVDRAVPALLNLANAGQSWRENGWFGIGA
jgi:hypothetical protein